MKMRDPSKNGTSELGFWGIGEPYWFIDTQSERERENEDEDERVGEREIKSERRPYRCQRQQGRFVSGASTDLILASTITDFIFASTVSCTNLMMKMKT